MSKSKFEGPLKPGTSPYQPSDTFEGSLKPGKPPRFKVPRSPITDPRDLLPPPFKPKRGKHTRGEKG